MEAGLWGGCPKKSVSIPDSGKILLFSPKLPHLLWDHPASYPVATRDFVIWGQETGGLKLITILYLVTKLKIR
jgi:hypothetical protein